MPLRHATASSALSFVYQGMHRANGHDLVQAAWQVVGAVPWANLHCLFWQTLIPSATAWMGRRGLAAVPMAVYDWSRC